LAREPIKLADALRRRFFSGLHLGLLRPGSRLPSVRDLATEMSIDRRVVLRAYRELEREGLVELRERSGIYFGSRTPGLPGLSPPAEWATDVVTRGLAMGIPAPEFPTRFNSFLSTVRLRALCIECNRDQLTSLCTEMTSDYGFEAEGADVDELLLEGPPREELRRADLLVTTQFHAGEVRELAARVDRPWIAVSLRTDIYKEIARLLGSSEVFFVVTDHRYAAKLHRIFEPVKGGSGFHSVVMGRDDVTAIPDGAPTYITRAARPKLGDQRLLERVTPEERVFSETSAREIISLMIGSNMHALSQQDRP